MAILKRAHVVLNTKYFVYVRFAGLDGESTITRHAREGMYITRAAATIYEKFTNSNEKRDEDEYVALTNRELLFSEAGSPIAIP